MKTITCPKCVAPVTIYGAFRSIKPFCGRCGWNLQVAEIDAASQSMAATMAPLVIGALVIFVSFQIGWGKWFLLTPLIFAVTMLLPFFQFVLARKSLYTAKTTANPNLASAQQPLEPYLQQLQLLASPRRVRFRFSDGASSHAVQDQAKDPTFSVYEDMTIPVFYDPVDPSKDVTLCATYLRVSTEPF